MTKKVKQTLFYSAVAIFVLLSYVVILYAQGYKYSFTDRRFVSTGAISLKVSADAKIYLDDHLEGTTSFFLNNFSIDRLVPGTYELRAQKDNYFSWQKAVLVEEGLVANFSKILLLPEEGEEKERVITEIELLFETAQPSISSTPKPSPKRPSPTPEVYENQFILKNKELFRNIDQKLEKITDNVEGVFLSDNENKLLWWKSNEIWVQWLRDTNYQPFYKKDYQEVITRFSVPIKNAVWFRGEDHIVIEFERKDSRGRSYSVYKVVEIDKRGGINIIEL